MGLKNQRREVVASESRGVFVLCAFPRASVVSRPVGFVERVSDLARTAGVDNCNVRLERLGDAWVKNNVRLLPFAHLNRFVNRLSDILPHSHTLLVREGSESVLHHVVTVELLSQIDSKPNVPG